MKMRYSILLVVFALLEGFPGNAFARAHKVTDSIVFSTIDYNNSLGSPRFYYLAKWDSQTGKTSLFFGDDTASTYPIKWSPSGRLLAVGRFGRKLADRAQICIIDRQGKLQRCLDDYLDNGYFSELATEKMFFPLDWSEDERYIRYFNSNYGYNFIEAEVSSGKITRTLYRVTDRTDTVYFDWTKDLQYLLIGVGTKSIPFEKYPLIKLDTQSKTGILQAELGHLITSMAKTQTADHLNANSPRLIGICPFSPKGNYILGYDPRFYEDTALEFIIYDAKTGKETQHWYHSANSSSLPQTCPSWIADESAFYFSVTQSSKGVIYRTDIYKYDLKTLTSSLYYDSSPEIIYTTSPLAIAPDGQYVAFETNYNPDYAWREGNDMPAIAPRIGVIDQGNTLMYIESPSQYGTLPLWVPPLLDIPTATPIP